ncbi:ExeM/NucH family extracellular endonuclease [Hymenobacter properus]|uniref:ExeM/NucH family extracellular endonuclease n=1 Tax=Hymenobacter properus TaxID=2791026 RepID=A0A931BLX2_9BACT|nr:ExeM/NucH family extracellular endonuclease [Hymenobacter properus]MBF9142668.1 ExeM/NucH family extracellular endonuclease [Hymenobacter properus]MBR7721476.1 ExeM/NucH family extracellular endonuclease [Microvirga sp. SRT04]
MTKVFARSFLLGFGTLLAAGTVQAQTVTPIGTIQTSGALATAGTYTIEAVVTAVYPGLSPAGFYVQNDAAGADGDPATSDALFVVQTNPTVVVGNKVRITGAVQEIASTPSFNQAVLTSPSITVLAASSPLPAFTMLDNATFSSTDAERYEGMRVQFLAPVTVSDLSTLKSRGELDISVRGLVYQPTQIIDPNDDPASGTSSSGTSNVPAVNAYQAANVAKSLLLDDGRAAVNPQPTPYLDATLGTVRVGSTIASLRGIMGYGGSAWRIQPLAGADAPQVITVRPAVPTFSNIDVKLASMNVLNFFNGDGAGGGFPTSRGAATLADFQRQRSKILAALTQMNADVFGLMEIENDGTRPISAIQDLVDGLNQAQGAGTYAFINDGGLYSQPNNTDLIHCAIIYKPAVVTPYGNFLLSTVTGVFERPPIAQLFTTNRPTAARDTFAIVVNHFKSKASGTGLNADQGDGQGGSNLRRKGQATALVQFINNVVKPAGTRYVVSVGDYNANYEEDPMDILRAAGFVLGSPAASASYLFNGLSGSLDHAVLTPNLVGHAAVEKWHINAAEPEFLEYDVAGAATDITSPFRSSDHDPVLVGLNFRSTVTAATAAKATTRLQVFPNPAPGAFNIRIINADGKPLTLEVLSELGQPVLALRGTAVELQAELARHTVALAPGAYLVRLRGEGLSEVQRVVKE